MHVFILIFGSFVDVNSHQMYHLTRQDIQFQYTYIDILVSSLLTFLVVNAINALFSFIALLLRTVFGFGHKETL
jgi:predicted MFS family arabinose efflux permease